MVSRSGLWLWLFNWLTRCRHKRTTFPQTPRQHYPSPYMSGGGYTYVKCLDCGKVLAYDWEKMEIEKNAKPE